ncbi:MAG: Nif3-like dinuclear metal center hexameric protein [Bacilli bacterium]|nr:Nif3-like dinuclear metal center hexameric protein [Bacilli bacterium]
MKTKVLLRKLSKQFPKNIGESYDFLGLQVGKLKEEVNKILVCLDFDQYVLPTVLKEKPDLIITHHPFIFGKKSSVLEHDKNKKELYDICLEQGITVYSYHTNFDTGVGGMNDALASALGLTKVKALESVPMARGGELPQPMEVHAFAKYAKEKLNVPYGLLIAEGKQEIRRVAIVGGGGWRDNQSAELENYDIFISGDIPHHGRRDIVIRKYNYLDLPHEVERIFIPTMTKILLNIDQSLDVVQVDHEICPEVI